LPAVLAGSAEYCEKVAAAALDFVCEEAIKETYYGLLKDIHWLEIMVGPRRIPEEEDQTFAELEARAAKGEIADERVSDDPLRRARVVARWQVMDPQKTKRTNFLCDYQIIRKEGSLFERRFVLKDNGRSVADTHKLLEEKRFSGLGSLLTPLRVLARDQQSKFDYALVGQEKVNGEAAHIVKAVPKSGDENGIWSARIWVDIKTFRILKCEIEGIPLDGFEDVLNDCVILNIKPIFLTTHEYRMERGGILLPWRSKVQVAYPGIDPTYAIPKDSVALAYDKYRFFTVETDHKIIK
jgi:hypothetical protein